MPKPLTTEQLTEMIQQDLEQGLHQTAEKAWIGESSVDEVQDLVWDDHAHVIDVSKMDPVWVLPRRTDPPTEEE